MLFRSSIIVAIFLFAGCVKKTPLIGGGPDDGGEEVLPAEVISIAYLKTMYRGIPYLISEDIEITGMVTANDSYNNFANSIVIQDDTGGIEIKLSGGRLFSRYAIGLPLRIRCQGLTLGSYGGMLSLGVASQNPEYENSFIPSQSQESVIIILAETGTRPQPEAVRIETLKTSDAGKFVCLEDVQFIGDELGLPWCDSDQEGFIATDRHIQDRRGGTLIVRTNASAFFAGNILPRGSGYIEGIISVFAGKLQLRVVYEKYVIMEQERF